MNNQIFLSVIEICFSLIIEGIILSMIFNWISSKETDKNKDNLKEEMNNIETQNKLIYEQLQQEIRLAKTELISQIKESAKKDGGN